MDDALTTWRKKRDALHRALDLESDAATKFKLEGQINEAEAWIAKLSPVERPDKPAADGKRAPERSIGLWLIGALVLLGGVGLVVGLSNTGDATKDVGAKHVSVERSPGALVAKRTAHRPALRYIPSGTFRMGSPEDEEGRFDDEVAHRVRLTQPFLLMETEVTQGQYQAVMDENPSYNKECGASCPVERVSWADAVAYANALSKQERLSACYQPFRPTCKAYNDCDTVSRNQGCTGYRLPTEAEWEYAARAGSEGARYGALDTVVWHGKNSGDTSHPVGTKAGNAWGLHDMLGNVWEWVGDWGGAYQEGDAVDPQGPQTGSGRVTRGGSWIGGAGIARAAVRVWHEPVFRYVYLGVRLARGPALQGPGRPGSP